MEERACRAEGEGEARVARVVEHLHLVPLTLPINFIEKGFGFDRKGLQETVVEQLYLVPPPNLMCYISSPLWKPSIHGPLTKVE